MTNAISALFSIRHNLRLQQTDSQTLSKGLEQLLSGLWILKYDKSTHINIYNKQNQMTQSWDILVH